MRFEVILKELKALADPEAVEGMSRFGINTDNTLGISISDLLDILPARSLTLTNEDSLKELAMLSND